MPPVNYTAKAFAYVVISVADMDQALGLWVSRFGMQIVVRRQGSDPGLAKLWGLGEGDIIDQALLVTPGREQGGVHLVRFRMPGAPVREGAAPTDLVPKSVDVAVHDIRARYAELEAAGYQFRSKIGRFETDGIVVHEVHMNGPESVNLVFLEQEGKPEHVSSLGYGVAPQVIATTPDNLGEKAFFEKFWDSTRPRTTASRVRRSSVRSDCRPAVVSTSAFSVMPPTTTDDSRSCSTRACRAKICIRGRYRRRGVCCR